MLLGIAYVDMKVAEGAPPRAKREKRAAARLQHALGIPAAGERDARHRDQAEQADRAREGDGDEAPESSPARTLMQAGESAATPLP